MLITAARLLAARTDKEIILSLLLLARVLGIAGKQQRSMLIYNSSVFCINLPEFISREIAK